MELYEVSMTPNLGTKSERVAVEVGHYGEVGSYIGRWDVTHREVGRYTEVGHCTQRGGSHYVERWAATERWAIVQRGKQRCLYNSI